MLIPILATIAGLIVIFIIVVATRPADFRIERSTKVAVPPQVVFAQVNDFHHWDAWSPWAKLDPAMKLTYDGPAAGAAAKYHWVGNKKVGEGRMAITDSKPGELVRIRLEFIKPFAVTNTSEFTFKAEGGQTVVTWTMTGRNNFVVKAFGLFVNIEKMIGADFEKGLAAMKAVAEGKR